MGTANDLQNSTNVKRHWKEKSLKDNNIMFIDDFK